MPKVRGGSEKWQRRASAAGPDYASGIQSPRKPWAQATREAETAYNDGVQAAIAAGSFGKAATAEAQNTWAQKASTLGQQRYAPGVQASKDRYEKGFAPYKQVLENLQLPARGRRGDPNNLQRVATVANALHDAKVNKSS